MTRSIAALVLGGVLVAVAACDPDGDHDGTPTVVRAGEPDDTLVTHAVEPSTPTPEGLAYLVAIADLQARADAAQGVQRERLLRDGLARPVPHGLYEAEIVRLDLAARLGETLSQRPHGAAATLSLLAPMLAPQRSLPLDRASARALVVQGDAAAAAGDDALAAGSYARAVRLMGLLRQELQR